MRHLGKSRKELFEQLDKPALKPLPERPYEFGEWKKATANVDYHIAFDNAFYSVPHQLVGKLLWVRASANSIEVYENLMRICSHQRTTIVGKYITEPSHRPKAHAEHAKWTPERITSWAASKGQSVGNFVKELIATKVHPEQGYRAALGIIRLADKYGEDRLNTACEKAIKLESYRYHTINNMLKNGMDKIIEKQESNLNLNEPFANPANVRGSAYYH
jgi:transposase